MGMDNKNNRQEWITKTPTIKANLTSSVKVWAYIENENIQKVVIFM